MANTTDPQIQGIFDAQVKMSPGEVKPDGRFVDLNLKDNPPSWNGSLSGESDAVLADTPNRIYKVLADKESPKDYEVGEKLGEGAFTRVFALKNDPNKVLKLFKLEEIGKFEQGMEPEKAKQWTEMFKRRFITKASLPLLLSHKGLEEIFDVVGVEVLDSLGNKIWLPGVVAERGSQTLKEYYKNYQALDREKLFEHASQIASAIDYLSQNNIELPDTKASNVMLRSDGSIFLADLDSVIFDLDKLPHMYGYVGAPNRLGSYSPATLSTVAPEMNLEIVKKQEQSLFRTTQYSLAATLWSVITKSPPTFVNSHSGGQTILPNGKRTADFDLLVRPATVGRNVWQVFNKALSYSPSNRYSNCTELIDSLKIAMNIIPKPKAA